MPTPNEVKLLIRAENEASKTLKGLVKELDELVASQKALTQSTDFAKASQAELVAQAKQLLRVTDDLNKIQSKVDGYKKQQQAIVDLSAKLDDQKRRLREIRDELTSADAPATKLQTTYGRLGRAVAASQAQIDAGREKLAQMAKALELAGVSAADLVGSERNLLAQQNRVVAALNDTQDAANRLASAQKELAATEARRGEQAKATAAEIKRRTADEEASLRRRIELQKRINEFAGVRQRIPDQAFQSARVFQQKFDKDDQAAITAEIKRRADIEEKAYLRQIALAKQLGQETERRRNRLADAVETFTALLDKQEREAVAAEVTKRAAAAKEAALKRQVEIQTRLSQQAEREARLRQAVETFQSATPDQLRTPVERAEALARAQRLRAEADLRVLEINRRADDAERRLNARRKESEKTIDGVTRAQTRANAAQKNGFELQRTALSLYQRIRGQVLSVTGAYVGLFGAINFVQRSLESVNKQAGLQSALLVTTNGDVAKANAQYKHLLDTANRLGLNFQSLGRSYGGFAVAAQAAGQTQEKVNFVFESFAGAARVMRLSAEDTQGVFKALEQIFSKGQIQAEELRGQLGDRLPGAATFLAKALGMPIEKFNKLFGTVQISSDGILLLAEELNRVYGTQLPAATEAVDAKVNRLTNSLDQFRIAFFNGPFGAEFTTIVDRVTGFFNNKDGTKFAKDLSAAFAAAGKVLLFLVENIKLVGTTIAIVFGAKTLVAIVEFGAAMKTAGGAVALLSKALGLGGLLTAIRTAGVALAGFLAGPLGAILAIAATGIVIAIKLKFDREAKERARAELDAAITGSFSTIGKLGAAQTQAALDPAVAEAKNTLDTLQRALVEAERKLETAKKSFKFFTSPVPGAPESPVAKRERDAIAEQQANVDDLKTQIEALNKAITAAEKRVGSTGPATSPLEDELKRIRDQFALLDTEGKDKLRSLKDAFANTADDIEKAFQQAQERSLSRTIDVINAEADAKINDLKRLQARLAEAKLPNLADQIPDLIAKVNAARGIALAAAEKDFADKVNTIEEQVNREIAENQVKSLERTFAVIDAEADRLLNDLLEKRVEAAEAGKINLVNQLDALIVKANQARDAAKDAARTQFNAQEVAKHEARINDLLRSRETILQTNNDLVESGRKTAEQANADTEAAFARIDPQIQAAIDKAREFLATLSGPEADAARESLDALEARFLGQQERLTQGQVELAGIIESNLSAAFDTAFDSLRQFAQGAASIKDVFKSIGQAARVFFGQLLIDIGQAIIKAIALKAILGALGLGQAGGDGGSGLIGAVVGVLHKGGKAGTGTPRLVDPSIFAGAIRYHEGGVVGLKSNEVPAILEKGETVLPKGESALKGGSAQNIQVVNTIDTESVFQAGATSQTLKKVILNIVRAERQSFKQALA